MGAEPERIFPEPLSGPAAATRSFSEPGTKGKVVVLSNKVPTHIYRGRQEERKGQGCRVLVRGNKNRCLVEFMDGFRLMTNRNTLRTIKQTRSRRLR